MAVAREVGCIERYESGHAYGGGGGGGYGGSDLTTMRRNLKWAPDQQEGWTKRGVLVV